MSPADGLSAVLVWTRPPSNTSGRTIGPRLAVDRALTKMEKELVNGLRQAAARFAMVLARRLGADIAPLGQHYWLKCEGFVVRISDGERKGKSGGMVDVYTGKSRRSHWVDHDGRPGLPPKMGADHQDRRPSRCVSVSAEMRLKRSFSF